MTSKFERAEGGHAPGPWFAVPYGHGNDTVICKDAAGNKRIAFMAIPGSRDDKARRKVWAEIKANAHLIAAAPELLEALEGAVHFSDAVTYRDDPTSIALRQWLQAGELAIAKVRGDV